MPVRNNAALLGAENVILCSDFGELNASRLSHFLGELGQEVSTARVLDGPTSLAKAQGFNVLAVLSGVQTQDSTKKCALDTVPYGDGIADEIDVTVQSILDGFEHPNPNINAGLGDTQWVSSNYYHETENWITVIIAMRTSSVDHLDFTMMRLFDLPDGTCEKNLACLNR